MLPPRAADGLVAGVCAGLADAYRRDVRAIRLLFLLATPAGALAYVVLWALMPEPGGARR